MAEESDLERTEPASPRRLEQAREEGQVPRSREVGAFLILIVAAAAFWLIGPWMVQRLLAVFRRGLQVDQSLAHDPSLVLLRLADVSLDGLLICAPLFVALLVAALLAPFFLGSCCCCFKVTTWSIKDISTGKIINRWPCFCEICCTIKF